jgi:CRISPR-associated protein Csd2
MSQPVQNRYDIVYLFDITDGNPNGDPDAGNMPRIDPETEQGLVTDVCLKRKIRNYVELTENGKPGNRIFVREKAVLNRQIEEAYEQSDDVKKALAEWIVYEKARKDKKSKEKPKAPARHYEDVARQWMCEQFYDIRAFGAVMMTGKEKDDEESQSKIRKTAGQVRGPVQLGMARSIDRIVSQEHAITVCAARTEEKPIEQQVGIQGRKFTIPYGLYRVHAYVSPHLADPERNGTGFSESDLQLFKSALLEMFENDKSAARANMRPCRCIAFRHESKLGNARADQLFARVKVAVKPELAAQKRPPRSFDDYAVRVEEGDLPTGVKVEYWV